ncbi:MAG: hypothetical protein QXS54_00900 [Candidatus Methanomethylicaceae archaeon]
MVADKSSYESPLRPPEGISYIIVNDTVVFGHGSFTKTAPGKIIRYQPIDNGGEKWVEGILWTGAPWSELPLGMAAPPPVGAASRRNRGCSWSCGGRFWPSSTTKRRSALVSVSPMAASPRPKRGAKVGKTKRGGAKWMVLVDGAGTALWSIPGLGIPGGGEAVGEDSRHGGGKASGQAPTAPQAPQKLIADRAFDSNPLRQRLKRRGNRADHPGAPQQQAGYRSRWAEAAPVPEAVDRGAHLCLAWAFSAPGGTL